MVRLPCQKNTGGDWIQVQTQAGLSNEFLKTLIQGF